MRERKGMHPTAGVVIRSSLLLLLFVFAGWLSDRPFFSSPSAIVRGPVLLSDPQGVLRPDEVAQRAAIHLARGDKPSLDINTRTYWWVADVENPGGGARWVVHVGNTAIERAELFVSDGRAWVHNELDLLAQSREGVADDAIGHHFPLYLPPNGQRTVLLRLETEVAHNGLIFVKPAGIARSEARFHTIAIWSAAGAIAALICYNLMLGINLRLVNYLFYVGHASGHLLYLLTALGIVGAGYPVLERYLVFNIPGIIIGVTCGALFVYSFLDLPTLSPRLARVYRIFIGAMIASPLLALAMEPHHFLTIVRGSHLFLALLVITAALMGMAGGKREARYILVGWGGLVAMTAKGMLGVLGVVELTIDAGIWALWAVLIEMFFLSFALADRVRGLSREKEAAQAANAAKSSFLANMSHEIRTPLNGVLGMVDILRGTRLETKQQEYVENIRQCGTALLSLLDDILDYSRVEAGQVRLEPTDFDPRELLDGLRFLLTAQAEKNGVRLKVTVDSRVPPVLVGDPGRLRQVLLNLLGNAVKFTANGEVHLKLDCLAQDVASNRLRFSVIDTGIGIEPEALKQLFDRFHQADNSISRRYGGTGLGLAIAKDLVTLMGGEIRVDSELGRGSRFQVELTLPTGTPLAKAENHAPVARLRSLNILVVDDDRINRLVASELLSRDGHQVETAPSGADALARVEEHAFDLVLMDLGMPDMDGLETTRRLRAAGVSVPVFGLTAHVLPEHEVACIDAGMNAVIHKPIQAEKLKQHLAVMLKEGGTMPQVLSGQTA